MAIGSYPRVTVEGTGASQNPQNGQGLMLLNPSTGLYESATASTFGGGGGGGDATSANQESQIGEAQTANSLLDTILNSGLWYDGNYAGYSLDQIKISNSVIESYLVAYGKPTAEYLNDIANNTQNLASLLTDIKNLLQNGTAKTQIVDSGGNGVNVTGNALNVDTGA